MTDTASKAHIDANPYRWFSLLVIALALAIVVIDGTVLNVSQKYIINDLNTNLKSIQWAITSYSLVLAALTILGGRLGDIFGRKRSFVIGAIIFAIGSLVTAFSQNITTLILGWSVIEGIGATLMIPASSALLVSNFQGKDRGIAFGVYGATAGAASSFGPIVGGYFATTIGWRWAFGINVVVAAILCLGSIIVRDLKREKKNKPFLDLFGVALSSIGLVSVTYGIIESTTYGWFQAKKPWEILGSSFNLAGLSISFWSIIIGIILLISFIFWELYVEKQKKEPLIRVEIFKNMQFTFGIATLATLFAGFSGLITYGVVFFFLTVRGLSAFEAGLALIPFSLASFIIAPLSSRIADKIGAKQLVQVGLFLNIIGTYLLYSTVSYNATVNDFIIPFIVTGLGFGLIIAQLTNLILSSVNEAEAGVASGINGTIREVGRSLGVALIGAVFIASLTTSIQSNISENSNIPESVKSQLITEFKNSDEVGRTQTVKTDEEVLTEAAKSGIKLPAPQAQKAYIDTFRTTEKAISESIDKAITSSSKESLLFTAGFGLIAFFFSFGLPSGKRVKK